MNEKGKFRKIRRRHKLLAFLRLIRSSNLLMIGLGQLMVGLFILETPWWRDLHSGQQFFFLILSTILVAAGGYIINDYYDVKIDVVNKPSRVVVGELISRRQTLVAHLLINAFGLGFALLTNLRSFYIVIFCAFWLWLYSNRLKRLALIGNFSVALITAISLYLPAVLLPPSNPQLILFCAFAFWISLIREMVKDMEDIRGDARHGCRTLPIVWGIRKTKSLLYGIGALFGSTFLVATIWMPPIWIGFAIVLGVVLLLFYQDLAKADTRKKFARLSLWCKWVMFCGILSMLMI